MTQIINRTTVQTVKNLKKTFDLITTTGSPLTTDQKAAQFCNIQKFNKLLSTDSAFKTMLSDQEQLESFKNDILKLQNYSSRMRNHQEVSFTVVRNTQHKNWIKELS